MEERLYELVAGAGLEPILMPRKQFFAEHKKLLKVLKKGDPKELAKMYKEQAEEVKKVKGGGTGSRSDKAQGGAKHFGLM